MLRLRGTAATHPGLRRSNNEDSAYAGRRLLLVADGMGGAAYGEIASAIATHSVTYLDEHLSGAGVAQDLTSAIEFADSRLGQATSEYPSLSGMGTTMTLLLLDENDEEVSLLHIGDSRAYLLRGDRLWQVTRDDTFVQMLADAGQLSREEVENHPHRHVLIKVLQGAGGVDAELFTLPAVQDDRYLLCSDGLSDCVPFDVIQQTLMTHPDPDDAILALIELALEAGGPDNVTCVIGDILTDVDVDPGEPQWIGSAHDLGASPLDVLS